jgi:hypothetical protein
VLEFKSRQSSDLVRYQIVPIRLRTFTIIFILMYRAMTSRLRGLALVLAISSILGISYYLYITIVGYV